LIGAGAETVAKISDYGKLLLPVMTAAMAAQGGVTGATVLYSGTALFDALLGSLISAVLVPMIYVYLTLSVAEGLLEGDTLKKMRDFVKWLVTWCLKTVLYIFTGYMSITGVLSGVTDKTAMKAAKLTISGAVPVVGGIMADASEAVLISAGVVKSSVGVYGLWAMIAIIIGPFLQIGVQYLLLKGMGAVCGVFSGKKLSALLQDVSSAMGLLLGMTGTVSMLFLISIVCFLKGVG
jgi:stage III sporulation protein AE